ncbi:histidine kinase/DNA gyrase B/HSP90-like ATPase [Paenibacillus taihuensis]|uniref:Histidine kinase/DNA gyrase B/HSP90-like ATPase n=1 Tax=Paenibacillus taihuensis TaxID=1156355 RepID=A0A3D9R3M7_9BACL|nr:sensor histidine kinase [Paenibacillus taihuensis]REE69676.1 histidine kinase/DNA gyrase B/HSP90-like ATPase [Paenibacillus taihuensis]
MRLLQQISLQKKLLIMMIFLYIPLPVIGWIWYEKTYNVIERNAIDSSIQMVNQVNTHLETYFTEVQRTMLPMLASDLTAAFLKNQSDDPIERFELSHRIEKELFAKIVLNRQDIYGISLISDRNKATSSSSFMMAEERYKSYLSRLKGTGKFRIMGLEASPSNEVVSMAMKFTPPQSHMKQGMLIVDMKRDQMVSIIHGVQLGRTGFVWVADSANQVIYHPDSGSKPATVPAEYLKQMGTKQSGAFTVQSEQGKKLIVFIRSDRTDLTLISEVLLSELNKSIVTISRISIVVLVLLFLLSMLAASGVVYSMTKSLLTLLRLMKSAEMGDFSVKAPHASSQEIGSLFRGFNKMVEEIKRLIEIVHVSELREKELEVRQKESLLHAMQAQINPHFLYNTLEFINSNAILEGNDKISNMIVSLGDMFRYNVQNPNGTVFLADEIRHIEAYLSIQAERYPSFNYEVELDRRLAASVPAVRSTLQPIVENCFKHGYEKQKLRPEAVRIAGRIAADDESCYELIITDAGKGMPPETMERYNHLFEGEGTDQLKAGSEVEQGVQSIGLYNVHSRLRMLFGAPYGLRITATSEQGTSILIKLPILSSKEAHVSHELPNLAG